MTSPSIIKTVIRFYYITSLVNLANGGASYGCVEVYYSGAWGTVCDDLWDINNVSLEQRLLHTVQDMVEVLAIFGWMMSNVAEEKLHCSTVRMQDEAQEILAMAITGMQVSFVRKKQEMLSHKNKLLFYTLCLRKSRPLFLFLLPDIPIACRKIYPSIKGSNYKYMETS